MADQTPSQPRGGEPIGGHYTIDLVRPLQGAGGGLPAFAVSDRKYGRTDLMAVRASRHAPARAAAVAALSSSACSGVLCPVASGAGPIPEGGSDLYVICQAPSGPALWPDAPDRPSIPAWSEGELIDCLLRPAALALDQLESRGVTHRAIRAGNLFRARSNQVVMLGSAWAAPPGLLQPAVFEPPYMAQCHPAMRGDGTIADDVYALGVVLLAMVTGRMPMAGLDDAEVVRRKLERGSFAALVGDERLPHAISDLIRNMVAEDPDHRPPPVLLADPIAARARRVAARPPSRASRPLDVGGQQAWDARNLAWALANEPEHGVRLLRGQVVDAWLRRNLGESVMASKVEEAVRLRAADPGPDPTRADTVLVLQAVASLDPLAPMAWRGLSGFPEGLGSAIAWSLRADPAPGALGELRRMQEQIETLILHEAFGLWAESRPDRCEPGLLRLDARQQRMTLRIPGWTGGLPRLRYALNALAPCQSPRLAQLCVVRSNDLLPALEIAAAGDPIDREIAAFLAVRVGGGLDNDLLALSHAEDPDIDPPGSRAVAGLRVLSLLQAREGSGPLPRLAQALLIAVAPALQSWHRLSVREARRRDLEAAAGTGMLARMLVILEDPQARAQDREAAEQAAAELRRMSGQMDRMAGQRSALLERARGTGQEVASAVGLICLVAAAVATALS